MRSMLVVVVLLSACECGTEPMEEQCPPHCPRVGGSSGTSGGGAGGGGSGGGGSGGGLADAGLDGGTDAGPCDFGPATIDFEWAQWRLHPISPPASAFTVTDETITDGTTQLIWQRFPSDAGLTWGEAQTLCENLTLEGLCGWRLPTIKELESIVDYGLMGQQLFPAPGSLPYFWSGTTYARDDAQAWVGPIEHLSVHTQLKSFRSQYLRVRCVRCVSGPCAVPMRGPGAPPGQYVVAQETVRDTKTGLTWQRNPPVMSRTLAEAQSYCANLTVAGTTWRLPNMRELLTLVDTRAVTGPAIDTRLGSTEDYYWTSTLQPEVTPRNYLVGFAAGTDAVAELDARVGQVRCVR